MGKMLKFGCLGIIGLVVVVVAIAAMAGGGSQPQQQISAQPGAPADKSKPALAAVGQTASLRGWEVTLSDFGPYERYLAGQARVHKGPGEAAGCRYEDQEPPELHQQLHHQRLSCSSPATAESSSRPIRPEQSSGDS